MLQAHSCPLYGQLFFANKERWTIAYILDILRKYSIYTTKEHSMENLISSKKGLLIKSVIKYLWDDHNV